MTKLISIVTPCYNEEKSVEKCIKAVRSVFANELKDYDFEHIFCDNSSTDRTFAILESFARTDKRIKLILNSRNYGPFKSMYNGVARSSGDAVVPFVPADLQDPPSLLPEMVQLWESGYDIVAGRRESRGESFFFRFARSAFYKLLNLLSEFEVPQGVGEFQLLDRRVVEAILRYRSRYPFLRTMIASVGFKRVILPYHWAKRENGKSRLSLLDLTGQALIGFFSFSSAPLRLSILLGFLIAFLCFVYGAYVVVLNLMGLSTPQQGIIALIVSLMFLFGVQLMLFGILGEYVAQIHRDVQGGNIVNEERDVNF